MHGVTVTECAIETGDFGAIIGMDLIGLGDFAITNRSGKTWMSFRVPSIEAIDYVQEANHIKFSGVGRNDPCPCGKRTGNGKPMKYKNCCARSPNRQGRRR